MSTQPSRRAHTTARAILLALALAACTPATLGTRPAATDTAATTTRSSAAASEPGARSTRPAPSPGGSPRRPQVGDCYRLDFAAATAPTSSQKPVPCGNRHTAQTYYVGRLETVVNGHLLAVDSRYVQRQVERTCPQRLARYVGGDRGDRALSKLHAVWFSPTLEESDAGASWFRCDVVAVARPGTLGALPPPRRMRHLLDRPAALDRFGLCGTAAPGTPRFERVICALPHAWRALSTIQVAGGAAYPGIAQVRRAGQEICRDRVRRASGSPERFRYGWEWPTREQWRSGQRFGYCWAPD